MQPTQPEATVKLAIDRVLEAERETTAAIDAAAREAEAILEVAREKRRRILDSARRRASNLHARSTARLSDSLTQMDADIAHPHADDGSAPQSVVDAAALRVAEQLTGGRE